MCTSRNCHVVETVMQSRDSENGKKTATAKQAVNWNVQEAGKVDL